MHNREKYFFTWSLLIIFIGISENFLEAKLTFANRSSTFIINGTPYSMIKLNQIGGIIGWSQESITKENEFNNPSNWSPALAPGSIIGAGGTPAPLSLIFNNSNAIANQSGNNQISGLVRTTSNALQYLSRITSNSINSGGGSLVRALSNALSYGLNNNSNALLNINNTVNTLVPITIANATQIRVNSNAMLYGDQVNNAAINSLQTQFNNFTFGAPVLPVIVPTAAAIASAASSVISGLTSKPWSSVGFPLLASSWSSNGNFLATAGKGPDLIGSDTALTVGDELRIYSFSSSSNTLTGLTSQSWSSVQNSIQTIAWNTKSTGSIYIAVGGQIPDLGIQGITINQNDALRIYQLSTTANGTILNGIVSKTWALGGEPINTIDWIQDTVTGRTFMAVGGENPDSGSETNINPTDGLRIYEFLPGASTVQGRLVGVTSKSWSFVGSAIHTVSWVQDTTSNRIFLAVGGTNPNAGAEPNINVTDGLRIYEFLPGSQTSTLTAITSVSWSTFGSPINSIDFTQDPSSNKLLLAVGGENPNFANGDPNINPGHEFRIYHFIPNSSIFGAALVNGVTSKDFSTQGFPINSVGWDSTSTRIVLGGSYPNTSSDTAINASDEIRIYSFNQATNALVGLGSKPYSTLGTPVFSTAWHPTLPIFSVGGGAANTREDINIGITDQLRLYQIPTPTISGKIAPPPSKTAATQAAQKKKWISRS